MVIDGNKIEKSSIFTLDMNVFLSKNLNVAVIDCHKKRPKRIMVITCLKINLFMFSKR